MDKIKLSSCHNSKVFFSCHKYHWRYFVQAFFGTAQKNPVCKNKTITGTWQCCQGKVGQRTYKQLLVIIIILSLFSKHERRTVCGVRKYLDTPSWPAASFLMTLWCKNSPGTQCARSGRGTDAWWEKMEQVIRFFGAPKNKKEVKLYYSWNSF